MGSSPEWRLRKSAALHISVWRDFGYTTSFWGNQLDTERAGPGPGQRRGARVGGGVPRSRDCVQITASFSTPRFVSYLSSSPITNALLWSFIWIFIVSRSPVRRAAAHIYLNPWYQIIPDKGRFRFRQPRPSKGEYVLTVFILQNLLKRKSRWRFVLRF